MGSGGQRRGRAGRSFFLLSWAVLHRCAVAQEWAACEPWTGCAGGVRPSAVVSESAAAGLRPCEGSTERFLTQDAMTGAVLEVCGGPRTFGSNNESRSAVALPVAECGEARIGAVAVDGARRRVYYAGGGGVSEAPLDGVVGQGGPSVELAAAYGVLVVRGESLGESAAEVLDVTIRGLKAAAAAVAWVSHRELRITVAHPALAGPRAPPSISPDCVTVTTRRGRAPGSASSPTHAQLDRVEYGVAAKPAVFRVETLEGHALHTHALALDAGRKTTLYFSSLGSTDGAVFGGVLRLRDGALRVVLHEAPRVTGLAFDPNNNYSNNDDDAGTDDGCGTDPTKGAFLYYSDAARETVARRPACVLDGRPGDAHDVVLAQHLTEPRGLALDPFYLSTATRRTVFVAAGGAIVKIDDARPGALVIVVPESGRSQPDGIIVLPGNSEKRGDRSRRLVWLDANRDTVRASTLFGTRVESLAYPISLRFPRAIARDDVTRQLVVGEWLGRIWRLPPPAQARADPPFLLRDDTSTNVASTVRQTLDDEHRRRQRLQSTFLTVLLL